MTDDPTTRADLQLLVCQQLLDKSRAREARYVYALTEISDGLRPWLEGGIAELSVEEVQQLATAALLNPPEDDTAR